MGKREILKKIAVSVLTLAFLTAIIGVLFRDVLGDIATAFHALSILDILWLFLLGGSYQLLDGWACHLLIRTAFPLFPYRSAVELTYLGVFSKTSTLGVGNVPVQAYYLHRCGMEVGQGVGTMTFSYVLHKTAVLANATLLLLIGGKWIYEGIPSLQTWLLVGYLICSGIIVALLLLCLWSKAHMAAGRLVSLLPDRGKWPRRKASLQEQLDNLYCGTGSFLKNKRVVLAAFLVHMLKLLILCSVPHACLRMLELPELPLLQIQLLTALILLLSGAIPNVAGIGPIEAGFFLMFSPLLGNAGTASALLLFRIATYYFPFLVSVIVFLTVQTRLLTRP